MPGSAEQQEPAAVWLPIGDLKPWDKNPRKNDGAVASVAESIKRFGFGAPIVARLADHSIIAGHTRWLAARKLGLAQVPVRLVDLDPADAQLLALADNKLGEIAEWDDARLAQVLADLKAQDADLAASGFDRQGDRPSARRAQREGPVDGRRGAHAGAAEEPAERSRRGLPTRAAPGDVRRFHQR